MGVVDERPKGAFVGEGVIFCRRGHFLLPFLFYLFFLCFPVKVVWLQFLTPSAIFDPFASGSSLYYSYLLTSKK